MATMTENLNLQRALLRSLDSRPGLSIMDNMKVVEISSGDQAGDDWPTLLLSDGRRIRARLLVSALIKALHLYLFLTGRRRRIQLPCEKLCQNSDLWLGL
jgi:hypothetical protein